MPRKPEPPRLYLRPDDKTWVIRDRGKDRRTGCIEGERSRAEIRFAEYLAEKHASRPIVGGKSGDVSIAEVMRVYVTEHAPTVSSPYLIAEAVEGLSQFWAHRRVSEIKGETCRRFAESKTSQSMARRQLETLRAAVHYFHREYGLDPVPAFTMPPKGRPRERWLTRSEAAALLRAARGLPHLQRFIVIGLYTGTRLGAALSLSWMPSVTSGWINLDAGVLHRSGSSQRRTKKRQPPVKIPSRLLAHLKRWKAMDGNQRNVIHWNGRPITGIAKAFTNAVARAGLEGKVTPHVLRHTSATWLMQKGVDIWETAGFLGMSAHMVQTTYGHHSPEFMAKAADAIGRA